MHSMYLIKIHAYRDIPAYLIRIHNGKYLGGISQRYAVCAVRFMDL